MGKVRLQAKIHFDQHTMPWLINSAAMYICNYWDKKKWIRESIMGYQREVM